MFAVRRVASFGWKKRQIAKNFTRLRRLCSTGNDRNNILSSECDDIVFPNTSLHEFVYERIEAFRDYTAVECSVTGRRYTYGDVRCRARNLSKYLIRKMQLQKGDVVAILLPNVPEYMIACLGILEAGLVITSLNPIYTAEEIQRQLLDSSAKVLITLNRSTIANTAKTAVKMTQKQLPVVAIKEQQGDGLVEGCVSFDELVSFESDAPDFHHDDPDSLAFLPYSSGTTGLPKGVELLHRNILANVLQASHPSVSNLEPANDTFQEVTPAVLPLFHIYGFTVIQLFSSIHGAKMITLPKFTPDLYIDVLKKHEITVIYVAPPLVLFLTQHPDVKPEYLKHLRTLTSGAAPLGQLDEEKFKEKFGEQILVKQGYGLTETSPLVCYYPRVIKARTNIGGSVGKAVPNTLLKIINPDDPKGTPLGVHQSGELLIKGPQVMKGYHNKPEETKNSFLDGWLRTGDIAYYNEDEFVFISDRLKELIKVKGYQVPPAELEEIIRDFPDVDDAAVIGIAHDVYGEVPRAYVVPKKGKNIDSGKIQSYVAGKVAKYKQLSGGVAVVQEIPKNATGKILRRKLKLMYEETGK